MKTALLTTGKIVLSIFATVLLSTTPWQIGNALDMIWGTDED